MNFEEITEVHVSGFWILTNHWSFCDVRLWDISNGFVAIMSDPSETLCWNSWQLIEILRDHIERESNRKFYSLSLAKILSTSPSLMESCEILSFPTMARHEMRLWLTEAGRGGRRKGGEDWTDCNNSTSRERTMLYPTRFIRSRSTRTRHLETRNWGRAGSNYCRSITWIQYRFLVAFCFPFQSKEYSVLQTNPISKVEQSLEQGVVYSLITKSRDVAVLSSGNITCCLNPRFVIRSLSSAVNFPPFLSFPPPQHPSPPPLLFTEFCPEYLDEIWRIKAKKFRYRLRFIENLTARAGHTWTKLATCVLLLLLSLLLLSLLLLSLLLLSLLRERIWKHVSRSISRYRVRDSPLSSPSSFPGLPPLQRTEGAIAESHGDV